VNTWRRLPRSRSLPGSSLSDSESGWRPGPGLSDSDSRARRRAQLELESPSHWNLKADERLPARGAAAPGPGSIMITGIGLESDSPADSDREPWGQPLSACSLRRGCQAAPAASHKVSHTVTVSQLMHTKLSLKCLHHKHWARVTEK
jgi:hypothetical protein